MPPLLPGLAPVLALVIAGAATPGLAPYRALAHEHGAELLAVTRAALEGAWDEDGAGRDGGAAAPSHDVAASAPDWPAAPAGVFLSLVRGSQVRACVGTPTPARATLGETLRALAREVVRADRRRPPVRREELEGLRVVISFAGESEPVSDPMLVDPGREALLVSGPGGSIAFLPGEARTVTWALREARRVGIVARRGEASFARFPVVVVQEPEARAARAGEPDADP